jgi:AraC-like DNA-binding protein
MNAHLVAFALEAAISAELLLFTAFLLTSRRRTAALYLLAGLSLVLGAMISANLLIDAADWPRLADLVLFLDLVAPALFFLYVRQVNQPDAPLRARDLLHALPASIGMIAWNSGLFASMDVYVIGCWTIYLTLAIAHLIRNFRSYAPVELRRFMVMLVAAIAAITALRVVIAIQAVAGAPFRSGVAYVFVLIAVFAVTGLLIFLSLHYPQLLTSPHIKYARSNLGPADLETLEMRFTDLFENERPYLRHELTIAELSTILEVPSRQISQLVNARFGLNLPAYINQCRIQYAAELLLRAPDKPIKIVMFEAGFTSKNTFNREFQRNMGVSPTDYRRSVTASRISG